MIVAESHRGRRLLLQLDRGAELLDAVAAQCRSRGVRSGVISVFGILEEAEVREFDAQRRAFLPSRRFSGSLTVVHLGGHVTERDGAPHVETTCVLAREGDIGVQFVGGRLVRARVHVAQVVIDCFDDVMLRSGPDPAGLLVWQQALAETPAAAAATPAATPARAEPVAAAPAPSPPPPPPPAPRFEAAPTGRVVSSASRSEPAPAPAPDGGGLTWADVAAHSAARGPVEEALADGSDDGDDEGLRAGDVIDHPRFGHCEVERIEGGGEYAQIRLRNRRLVRLSLDVIQLVRNGRSEEGRRRFRAQVAT